MRSRARGAKTPTFTEQARRAQILGCAADALAELGFAGASLAEIAQRAQVSKGVVSYYFQGKDDLLVHVVADFYSRAGAAIGERITGLAGSAALRGYVQANLAFLGKHPVQVRAVVEIVRNLRRPDGQLWFDASGDDPVLGHLEQLLRDGQAAGDLRDFDARAMAVIIRGAIDTASGRRAADPSFDLSAYTNELLTVIDLATRRAP